MKLIFTFIAFLFASNGIGQYNLVPNYSFEDSVLCPSIANMGSLPRPWYSPSVYGSGNNRYLNSCAIFYNWGVPYNIYYDPIGNMDTSFQYAKTGQGYASIEHSYDLSVTSNSRYYLQIKLKSNLSSGKCYYCEFWVSLINPVNRATNNIAMLLTNAAIYSDTIANSFGSGLIAANPQVVNWSNPVIKDTMNWVKVSSIVTAQGGERYLTIGNFKTDAQTTIQVVNTGGQDRATYYVDDVSIIPLDSMALKADAGPDRTIASGDSSFIGSYTNGLANIVWRNSSGAIINTTAPGIYVKPTTNTFYTLEQMVCGQYSKDTVNITVTPPLPLKFLSFTATATGGKALLHWQTANEENVNHFNVQRSTDGNTFLNIGQVGANNQAFNQYSFSDTLSAKGTRFYRIENVDKDGKRNFSTIKKVDFNNEPIALQVYPNPAKDFVTIAFPGIRQVVITNADGREILHQSFNGVNAVKINVSHYSKGLFLIKMISTTNSTQTKKLLIL